MCVSLRDRLIEQLTREIQALKDELESFRLEVTSSPAPQTTNHRAAPVSGITVFLSVCVCDQSGRLCQALRGRVNELEAELAEQSHLRLQAAGESEFLKAELEDLRRVREDTEKEQRSLTEIESMTSLLLFRFYSVTSVNREANAKTWGKHGTSNEVFTLTAVSTDTVTLITRQHGRWQQQQQTQVD